MAPFDPIVSPRRRMAAALAAGLWGSLVALGTAQPAAPAPAQTPSATAEVVATPAAPAMFSLKPEDPLFKLSGKTWKTGEWEEIIRFSAPGPMYRLGVPMVELETYPEDQVANGIREFAFNELGGAKAREAGTKLSEPAAERVEREKLNQAVLVWLEQKGVFTKEKISPEDARKSYEERKESTFKIDEQMELRHIYLSTYEKYSVKEGDTLESIAQSIAGSADKAAAILSKETAKPRADKVKDKDGNEVDPQPLQPGEELMVPMSDAKAAEVEARAQAIYERLKAGEAFDKVAQEVSEAENPAKLMTVRPKKDEKPVLDEVRKAFESIGDGEFSKPFRTRHGFQIVQRVRFVPEGYTKFEDVQKRVESELVSTRRQSVFEQRINELWKADTELKIDEAALANGFDEAHGNDVIFQIEDVKYLASNFRRDFIKDPGEGSTVEQRRAALTKLPLLQRYLLRKSVTALKIEETDLYKQRMAHLENVYLANQYMDDLASAFKYTPTEEEIAARYKELVPAVYTRVLRGDLWVLTQRVDPQGEAGKEGKPTYAEMQKAAVESLTKLVADVDSSEKFEDLARKNSADEFAMLGGHIGTRHVYEEGGKYRMPLQESQPNSKTRVYADSTNVYVYWVGDRSNAGEASLEQVRQDVTDRIMRDKRAAYANDKRKEITDAGNLEILFGSK